MRLLDTINSPSDLKKVPRTDLPLLAQEIREEIIRVTSVNGGHLATNLGIVELTLALHAVFDAPRDKIVWDTGNQVYAHKLITGRREQFHTIRQFGGLSGFTRREESPYDTFNAGHAGTSISAALGMVEARDHLGQDHKVIAVIGDGAMTAGMVYEGLNQAGASKKDFIVILNDNEMSISKNVGAISAYLSRIITGQLYTKVKEEAKHLLKTIPRIGQPMIKAAHKVEESAKGFIGPGLLFEELGFLYIGPIDGNRFEHLFPTLENISRLKGPILVHVITKKGKGYEPAEQNPVTLHAASPFQVETGRARKTPRFPTYTGVFASTLTRLAKRDRQIMAITAAMPEGTGLSQFAKEFPDRCYDVGIAEPHAVTFAAGLAAAGLRPVVAIYSTFMQRAYDQIVHDVCIQNLPVVLCLDRAGLVGEDGHTHHGIFDIGFLRILPNLVIMAPKDENELQHMVYTASKHNGPVAIRYPRGEGLGVGMDARLLRLSIGKAELLKDGGDVAILALGHGVHPSLQVARELEKEGIAAAVVNARFVKPLDRELILQLARRTRRLITVEEHVLQGGFGSAVLEILEEEGLSNVEVKRIGLPDQFIEHGAVRSLRERFGFTPETLLRDVHLFVQGGLPAGGAGTVGASKGGTAAARGLIR
ncbi:MAG TPA: 1-deoxy-D-xylulose-5-phosphate synthase [Nitrospiria bacterium]|nr:1-deoxy-D-xylulose-5-phosphate synthase [Nitrospiria bacterium]